MVAGMYPEDKPAATYSGPCLTIFRPVTCYISLNRSAVVTPARRWRLAGKGQTGPRKVNVLDPRALNEVIDGAGGRRIARVRRSCPHPSRGARLGSEDMGGARHCRHCLGDCPGDCLLPGQSGLCIHNPTPRMALRDRLLLIGSRRFWKRVLWGRG
jgi:hypothetical protein